MATFVVTDIQGTGATSPIQYRRRVGLMHGDDEEYERLTKGMNVEKRNELLQQYDFVTRVRRVGLNQRNDNVAKTIEEQIRK